MCFSLSSLLFAFLLSIIRRKFKKKQLTFILFSHIPYCRCREHIHTHTQIQSWSILSISRFLTMLKSIIIIECILFFFVTLNNGKPYDQDQESSSSTVV